MIKVIITEEGKSNKPVAFLSMDTQTAVFDYWADMLIMNPGKYKVEVYCEFVFSEKCSDSWHNVFGALCIAYQAQYGQLTDEKTKAAFIGVLQGFALAEDRLKEGD